MTKLTSLLVGMHFRPPAKTLLASLPSGTPLRLQPEPENPYDPLAVAVFVPSTAFPDSQKPILESALPNNGFTLEEVLAQNEWHLGYVGASDGKPLAKANASGGNFVGNAEFLPVVQAQNLEGGLCHGLLGFAGDGSPTVQIDSELPVDTETGEDIDDLDDFDVGDYDNLGEDA